MLCVSSVYRVRFRIGLGRLWSSWKESLILVTPRTVVTWHRAGFRLYWKWLSRARHVGGRKPVSEEVRKLIFRMGAENPTWGAPRIHGELLNLGFDVSEPTVSRWLRRVPSATAPGQRWLTFLRNHRTAIGAMDFFTVPRSRLAGCTAFSSLDTCPSSKLCEHAIEPSISERARTFL
jgi:hypothetical protein